MSAEAKWSVVFALAVVASTPWWLLPWIDRPVDAVKRVWLRRFPRRSSLAPYRMPGGDR